MTITTTAFALLDGLDVCIQAEKLINDEIARNRKRTYDAPITTEDFVESALIGADFPENPFVDNEKIRVQRQNDAVRGAMLSSARKSVQARKQDLIVQQADKALTYLSDELATLMDEVRAVGKTLTHVTTAEQVLNAGDPTITTAWKSRQELISRYNEIRGLQHTFSAPGMGDGQSFKIAAAGHIRNSLEQSDFWLSRRRESVSTRAANDQLGGVRDFDAWLGNGGTAPFKHSTSATPATDSNGNPASAWDYLMWLATKAEPWVPSLPQVSAAFDAAHLAVTVTDYAKYRTQEAGRDKYFEVIGRKPLVSYGNASSSEKPENRKVHRASWGEAGAQAMGL